VGAQELSPQAKAELKDCDRLRKKTQELKAAGNLAEAIASAKAMLAIERKVLPADHDDIAGSLNLLAELHADREEFASANTRRSEVLEILRKRYGEKYWKVTDARLALEDVDRSARMTHDRRQERSEADRLKRQVDDSYRAGKYAEALKPARRTLEIQKKV